MGSVLIAAMFAYILWGPGGHPPFPMQGFGWDIHLVLPVLVLMLRPTAQIAQVVSGLLVNELGKPYIVTARSVGNTWRAVFRRHAFRNIIAPVAMAVSGALRLLVGELVVVELLFYWPGLGLMIAQTLIPAQTSTVGTSHDFLNPPVLATLLALFAALFLLADFITGIVVRKYDPRLHTT